MPWTAATAIVAPLVFGLGVVRCLGLGRGSGTRVALAYGYLAGHLLLAPLTAAWLALARPLPGFVLALAATAAGIALLRRSRGQGAATTAVAHAMPMDHLPRAAFVVLALLLAHACLITNVEPIRFSDEAQIWAAKAKVLFTADTIDLRSAMGAMVSHGDYPPLDPLVQVWSFAMAGRVQHFENRMPIQFFGVALLALLSASMGRRANPLLATVVLVAFAGSMFWSQAQVAYADVLLALATLGAIEALLRLRETGEVVWWRLTCLSAAAMLATKNEGSLLAIAVAAPFALSALRRIARRELAWLLVPATAAALHRGFNAWFLLHSDLFDPAAANGRGFLSRLLQDAGERLPHVASYYGRMLLDPGPHRWIPVTFLAVAAIALATPKLRPVARPVLPLLAAFVAATIGYVLVFVATPADLQWHLDTAAARTLLQAVPIAALGLAMVVWPRDPSLTTASTARPAPPS